jgi:hypothetical protein
MTTRAGAPSHQRGMFAVHIGRVQQRRGGASIGRREGAPERHNPVVWMAVDVGISRRHRSLEPR